MARWFLSVVSVLLVGAACAAPVMAQGGNGLYEPFPQPRAESRAQAYAARLGVSATKQALARGVFVGRSLPAKQPHESATPSGRAGLNASSVGRTGLLVICLGGVGLGALGIARSRPLTSTAP